MSDDVTKNVVKAVNKILEVYLNQVFGPLIRDVKKIEDTLFRLTSEIEKLNESLALPQSPDALAATVPTTAPATAPATAAETIPAADDGVTEDLAATSSKKNYIYEEMLKVIAFFEASEHPESKLFEKGEIKNELKSIESFLNKEAGSAGTPESIVTVIRKLIKVIRDTEYRLNSSAQARFYKEDFITFIGKEAAKSIKSAASELH